MTWHARFILPKFSDSVVSVVRRELKRLSPDVRIDADEIMGVMSREVVKRELLEGEKAEEAKKRISKAACRALRTTSSGGEAESNSSPIEPGKSVNA